MTDPFLALALLERDGKPLIPELRVPCRGCNRGQRVYTRPDPEDSHRLINGYAPCPLCVGRGWLPLRGPAGAWALLEWAVAHDLEIEFRPDRSAGPHICMFNWNWGDWTDPVAVSPDSLARAVLEVALLEVMQPLVERDTGAA